tara:strand:+ start:2148 stop:2636 length:489 start_codon:yes stop_codon:yes gene_type:complete
MKTLILVRHAKSSWEYDVIDHERPLNKRGQNDALMLSKHVKSKNLTIDLVLSSDAVRAKTTADIFMDNLNISQELFRLNHNLYDFSGENLTQTIKQCDDSINHLMIFGHNHAITSFVNTYGDKYIDNVPTCGVTIIEFEIDFWKNLNQGKTISTLFPRDLKS